MIASGNNFSWQLYYFAASYFAAVSFFLSFFLSKQKIQNHFKWSNDKQLKYCFQTTIVFDDIAIKINSVFFSFLCWWTDFLLHFAHKYTYAHMINNNNQNPKVKMEHFTGTVADDDDPKKQTFDKFSSPSSFYSVALFISISKGKSAVDINMCAHCKMIRSERKIEKKTNWLKIVIKMHVSVLQITPSVPMPSKCL